MPLSTSPLALPAESAFDGHFDGSRSNPNGQKKKDLITVFIFYVRDFKLYRKKIGKAGILVGLTRNASGSEVESSRMRVWTKKLHDVKFT